MDRPKRTVVPIVRFNPGVPSAADRGDDDDDVERDAEQQEDGDETAEPASRARARPAQPRKRADVSKPAESLGGACRLQRRDESASPAARLSHAALAHVHVHPTPTRFRLPSTRAELVQKLKSEPPTAATLLNVYVESFRTRWVNKAGGSHAGAKRELLELIFLVAGLLPNDFEDRACTARLCE
jgi:hypothetical protein